MMVHGCGMQDSTEQFDHLPTFLPDNYHSSFIGRRLGQLVSYKRCECCAVFLKDSVDSVILLDSMSSEEEDTLENNDVTQEMEAKDRTEWLMSMAEYRDEIYEYLRKSEVPVSVENNFYSSHSCRS